MWEMIDTKSVQDFDGFFTDYTLYCDGERFVCVFGDNELYGPEDESNWDFETDDVFEAHEWFDDYSLVSHGVTADVQWCKDTGYYE